MYPFMVGTFLIVVGAATMILGWINPGLLFLVGGGIFFVKLAADIV